MRYPSSFQFIRVGEGVRVERTKKSLYNAEIWTISYIFNEDVYKENADNIIYLDGIKPDTTKTLRLYCLPKILNRFSFLPDITEKAEEIIDKIKGNIVGLFCADKRKNTKTNAPR